MLLDRIDIDAHGPLNRVELGPFSEHLNVICGPEGSGKTAIARFIRDSLVHREYPLGMMSSSTGRVVWADRHGLVHCRREKDGTATGRRTVQFDPRGDFLDRYDSLQRSWIKRVIDSTDESRAHASIQIPESIVDGVITDTAVTSVARVVSACVRSGLDDPSTFQSLPVNDVSEQSSQHQRQSLRAQLADVEAELARLRTSETEYHTLIARRNELTSSLAMRNRSYQAAATDGSFRTPVDSELADLERRIGRLRNRQDELRQSIAELDRRATPQPQPAHGPTQYSHYYSTRATHVDESLSRKLDDMDAQIIRWRRTLTEVHALRDALSRYIARAANRYGWDAHHFGFPAVGPLDDLVSRRRRLNGLLHRVDRYEQHSPLDPGDDGTQPLTSADIDVRIDAATRQIDWLLERYAVGDRLVEDWCRAVPCSTYGANRTVAETLRAIRHDLAEVRRRTHQPLAGNFYADQYWHQRVADVDELRACERWLSASIDQLVAERESLLNTYHAQSNQEFAPSVLDSEYLHRERSRRINELDRVTGEMNQLKARVAELRSERGVPPMRGHRHDDSSTTGWIDREALVAELCRIDQRLADVSRAQWLRARRSQLMGELGVVRHRPHAQSPLAEAASRWLVRLSAGRIRRVDWPYASFKSASLAHSIHLDRQPTGVCLDGRDESDCPAADRALAVLAVRMAAGDLLAKTGRAVPLVLETHRELLQAINVHPVAAAYHDHYTAQFHDWNADGRSNHPIAAALHDYVRSGRQVVVLTSSQALAHQIHRDGGRSFQLFANRTLHPHRPIWRPHYAAERYVGPYPHTYGAELAPDQRTGEDYAGYGAARRSHRPSGAPPRRHPASGVDDVNRNFDMAWREAYGLYDPPEGYTTIPATDWAPDGVDLRDGYYVADSFTTQQPAATPQASHRSHTSQATTTELTPRPTEKRSPFFLSVDSPIDQAPSIDAVAAARLRGLKITHINHLMQQDSNRLADALGLSNVDAPTIRRWQSECRLCCRVPQLRGFDSRVLVGCGVSDPAQLASIHPTDLLERVESFLATAAGQRILRTGSSHELSRITSWIASARSSGSDRDTVAFGPGRVVNGRVVGQNQSPYAFDSDRYEYEVDDQERYRRRSRRSRPERSSRAANGRRYGIGTDESNGSAATVGQDTENGSGVRSGSGSISGTERSGSRSSSGRRRRRRSSRDSRGVVRMERKPRDNRQRTGRQHQSLTNGTSAERERRSERTARSEPDSQQELRFFLQRDSAIVDAPSIGARMAERLNEVGVDTVDDLLNADSVTLAAELGHRQVDAATIEAWQQQAILVCRIPMLRGHDAQLLVAAEVTTTEEVAESDADELFSLIDPIARSSEGKRIIRGGKLPDLDEIKQWIRFARQNRDLVAA